MLFGSLLASLVGPPSGEALGVHVTPCRARAYECAMQAFLSNCSVPVSRPRSGVQWFGPRASFAKSIALQDRCGHVLNQCRIQFTQVRGEFDPGIATGRHTHSGEELTYILERQIELRIEGQPPRVVKAGETFFVPAGLVHEGINTGGSKAKVLATYIVEKGQPLAPPASSSPRRRAKQIGEVQWVRRSNKPCFAMRPPTRRASGLSSGAASRRLLASRSTFTFGVTLDPRNSIREEFFENGDTAIWLSTRNLTILAQV